jgi:hypothetical protein
MALIRPQTPLRRSNENMPESESMWKVSDPFNGTRKESLRVP